VNVLEAKYRCDDDPALYRYLHWLQYYISLYFRIFIIFSFISFLLLSSLFNISVFPFYSVFKHDRLFIILDPERNNECMWRFKNDVRVCFFCVRLYILHETLKMFQFSILSFDDKSGLSSSYFGDKSSNIPITMCNSKTISPTLSSHDSMQFSGYFDSFWVIFWHIFRGSLKMFYTTILLYIVHTTQLYDWLFSCNVFGKNWFDQLQ